MKIEPWEHLTREKQDLYLTVLWRDGYSEKAIADFLSTTKGRIVRRRQLQLHLPNEGRPVSLEVKQKVDPQRFADLLDIADMNRLEEQGVSSIAPPSPHEIEEDGAAAGPGAKPPEQGPEFPKENPVPEAPAKEPHTTCQWPLNDSSKLRPRYCGKPVVPGHEVCDEHLAIIQKYR
jgi:hypothetical protein